MSATAARGYAPSEEEQRAGGERPARPLGSAWDWPQTGIWSGVLVLLRGPAPPPGWPAGPFFPDLWIRGGANWELICLSALLHILLILFPIRMRFLSHGAGATPESNASVAWMGSSKVLLPYIPALRKDVRKAVARAETAPRGAHAFDPLQTIVSKPKVATHPRQTLIEPAAKPEAPKILTPLPDIVEWPSQPKPAPRRHLHLNPNARMRQRLARSRPRTQAPDVPISHALPEITFSSQHPDLPKPALEVKTNARPTYATQKRPDEEAPDAPATINPEAPGLRLVALSENPAPPPAELQVPVGNLTAQFVKSPDGATEGAAGSASTEKGLDAYSKRAGGARSAPIPGIAIVGANRGPVSNIAGPPAAPGMGASGSGLAPPRPGALGLGRQPGAPAAHSEGNHLPVPSIQERIRSAIQPEDLLEPGRIYTIHVSMPNLASVTGTWTLKFVELDENGKEIPGAMDSPSVAGPVPLRKVDPKYPPAYINAKVQGDVILYAIIRRDGSVDSIEVVKSLDPQLDQNAMEALARWKFQAAQREGRSVELAAIVRIPFRVNTGLF
ncbi:MAG TPA: TonB family protein [Candidatus Acidoferrales bacterium]|nr:TonB family protein [Candidatus Acidoferrales bacterium]